MRLLRRGTRWPRCGWPAIVIHRSRPRCVLGSDPVRRVAARCPRSTRLRRTGRQVGLSRLSPPVTRRSGRPRYAFWPGVSFPSGVARCQQPRTCSGAAFIKFQVSAPAQITASNSGSSWLGPSKSAAVPVNTENAPPPAPDSRASRCSTVPRQIPHVEGAFDVHVDPRPRSGSQHPRSWPRPITVSCETMSPPSGPYRRRPADFIRLCVE